MRVISLLPSTTEMVHALGRGVDLVGRSEECDFPSVVRSLPVVMRARERDAGRPSAEIDARVRASLRSGESLYTLDLERLAELRPDLLLTQDLCRVCSVTDAEVIDGCRKAGVAPRIVSFAPTRLEEVWASVERLGAALGVAPAGGALARELRRRAGEARAAPPAHRPRVAVVEWVDPPILSGLWTPDLIAAAGGLPIGPAAGEGAHRTTWEALRSARPDLVVVSPCSFSVERTRREIAIAPEARNGLRHLARTARVLLADEAYFSRPGPRLADGVELVRSLVDGRPAHAPYPVEPWDDREEVRRA